jgi:murein DD-endopeptidase MepM/ murein hydrolase activator NlpD
MSAAVGVVLAGCSSGADRLTNASANNDPIYTASVPKNIQQVDSGGVASQPIEQASVSRQPLPYANNANNYQTTYQQPTYQQPQPTYQQPQQAYTPQPQPQMAAVDPSSMVAKGGEVQVEPGMTLFSIAQANNVSVRALAEANNLSAPYAVRTGQVLRMPGSGQMAAAKPARTIGAAPVKAGGTHQVASGETLYSLGRKYGVSHAQIASLNGLSPDSPLSVGQELRIPAGATTRVAAAPAAPEEEVAKTGPSLVQEQEEEVSTADAGAAQKPKDQSQIAQTEADAPQQAGTPAEETDTAKAIDPSLPGFRWPVKGKVISGYGSKPNGLRNEGINIAVPEGTSVRAADTGVVAYAGNELKGYGNLVLIRHDGGWVTAYAHNKELFVKRGDTVKRGDIIAKAGQTGSVSSPQVHFEIRKGATAMDPMKFLNSATAAN